VWPIEAIVRRAKAKQTSVPHANNKTNKYPFNKSFKENKNVSVNVEKGF